MARCDNCGEEADELRQYRSNSQALAWLLCDGCYETYRWHCPKCMYGGTSISNGIAKCLSCGWVGPEANLIDCQGTFAREREEGVV